MFLLLWLPVDTASDPTVDCDNCAETGLWNKDFVELALVNR